jgi:hypothetical protein
MPKTQSLVAWAVFWLAGIVSLQAAENKKAVIIYDGVATEISAATEESKDLWLTLADLTRATKFELKPEGVCTDKLCFPLPATRKQEFLANRSDGTRFNLSEFARLLKQPIAHDVKHALWYFGPRPEVQNRHVTTLTAPDFTLPDVNGKSHSLSDFRGKKVLLITWASW